MLLTERQGVAIAGGEQIIFAEAAAVPHRPNRVDHVPGLQSITLGDFGIAGRAAMQRAAFG